MTAKRGQRVWIGNGTLVCQDRLIQNGSVLVEGDRIIALNQPRPQDVEELDACQGYILPGFIDLHVHLRDPGLTEKETLETGAPPCSRITASTASLKGRFCR